MHGAAWVVRYTYKATQLTKHATVHDHVMQVVIMLQYYLANAFIKHAGTFNVRAMHNEVL